MKPISIPVKIFLITSSIAVGILIAFLAMPHTPAPVTSGPVPSLNPADNISGLITYSSENNQILPSQSFNPLATFSSKEEVQTFLKSHTVPYIIYYQNSRRFFSGSTGTISVIDCNSTRIWRYTLDTSTFKPNEYIVTADAVNGNATGYALFNVLDGIRSDKLPKMNRTEYVPVTAEKYYITVNPVGDRYRGEKVIITGSTNLPAGEDILVQVYSTSFIPTQKSQNGEFNGVTATTGGSGSASVPEFSTTNIQVAGVDEADIIKTDGTNIYTVAGNTLSILRAYPAQDAHLISKFTTNGTPRSLYVNGERLILFVTETVDLSGDICGYEETGDYFKKTRILIYSISDPGHPVLLREIDADGDYLNSRMIGPYLYFITTKPADFYSENLAFLSIREANQGAITPVVYNFGQNNTKFSYTMAGSVNVHTDNPVRAIAFLTGTYSTVYVSPQRLYLGLSAPGENGYGDKTNVYAFSLENGNIRYTASGSVEGSLINQYSLDEYNGNLRVATNVMEKGYNLSVPINRYSNVFVLDDHLNIIGKVEHIAPNEILHSTRFIGDRLYMVTFLELDPFFVIDLSDPTKPKILGELKIPGFSDYLHPYDNTHIIGVGQETIQNERGGTVSRGIKISLFDVSNVTTPTLIDSEELGGAGSESEVFTDPKAFLFDRQKNLLVLPVFLRGLPVPDTNFPSMYEGTLTGVYVFGVDPVHGFTDKGTVIHAENNYSASHVKRALYISDTLYTMSNDQIIISDLNNFTHMLDRINLN